jgi:hypothetical protein
LKTPKAELDDATKTELDDATKTETEVTDDDQSQLKKQKTCYLTSKTLYRTDDHFIVLPEKH